jgi:hypothetical protein
MSGPARVAVSLKHTPWRSFERRDQEQIIGFRICCARPVAIPLAPERPAALLLSRTE